MATLEPRSPARPTLGPEDHGRPVSADEFAAAVFREPWRYERAGGRLLVMSPEGEDHANAVEPWRDELILYRRLVRPDLVERVKLEAWVRVRGGTDRIGDIGVYLATDRPAPPIPDRVPDLMFEVVSPGREDRRRDYVEKRAEYLRIGVREYVIIDRTRRRVTIYSRADGGHRKRVLTTADIYTSPLLPGLEIPIAGVMAR